MQKTLFILYPFMFSTPAFAHIGHVGELAGHGHVIAIGATIAAAALAGLIVKGAKNSKKNDEDAESDPSEQEPETAAKPA